MLYNTLSNVTLFIFTEIKSTFVLETKGNTETNRVRHLLTRKESSRSFSSFRRRRPRFVIFVVRALSSNGVGPLLIFGGDKGPGPLRLVGILFFLSFCRCPSVYRQRCLSREGFPGTPLLSERRYVDSQMR